MDAECKVDKRKSYLESRKQRWSMNSQRLEEIVAELMRPIGDLRRSFDTDLSALLEEYLTEAGLHALDEYDGEEEEGEEGGGPPTPVAPNFAELALLLQQSASIYGRKVDFLYQHVLSVSDSLHTAELLQMSNEAPADAGADAGAEAGAGDTPVSRRRSAAADRSWAHIELAASGGAAREGGEAGAAPRPPPTLPRAYLELEPRALHACDAPLTDYAGEPVGLLTDFHVAWRLREGMLVEELEPGGEGGAAAGGLRAIPLTELQAALSARAPPLPPPSPPPPSPPPSPPPHASTPLPLAMDSFDADSLHMPPPEACKRKRKREPQPADLPGRIKLLIGKELRRELRLVREFSVPAAWVRAEVRRRSARVLALRRRCAAATALPELRGFEYSSCDADGFPGWSSAAAAAARAAAAAAASEAAARLADPYSDDDGFFEQSSSGDSDEPSHHLHNSSADASGEWWSWQAGVAARAAAAEARGPPDVRALAARLLAALPPPPRAAPRAARRLLAPPLAADAADVSRLFLATLFLANSGNVEIIQGAPLSVDSFSVRLITADERLYGAAAARDAGLLPPAAPAAAGSPPSPPSPPAPADSGAVR